jgi:DNA-binding MarR family transcriptional regulator
MFDKGPIGRKPSRLFRQRSVGEEMKFDPEQRPVANSPAVSVPVLRHRLNHSLSDTEWRQDLLLFWFFRTCARLQIALDWYFLPSGLTMQEARVLHRCVENHGMKAGTLANSLGKDKGQISRIVDNLVAARLVSRDVDHRDRRCSVIIPTEKGKKKAEELGHIFKDVRKRIVSGLDGRELAPLEILLSKLQANARMIRWKEEER